MVSIMRWLFLVYKSRFTSGGEKFWLKKFTSGGEFSEFSIKVGFTSGGELTTGGEYFWLKKFTPGGEFSGALRVLKSRYVVLLLWSYLIGIILSMALVPLVYETIWHPPRDFDLHKKS